MWPLSYSCISLHFCGALKVIDMDLNIRWEPIYFILGVRPLTPYVIRHTSYVIRHTSRTYTPRRCSMTYDVYVIRHWEWRPLTYDVYVIRHTSYVIRQGRIRHGGAQWRMTYTSYVIRHTSYVIRHWEWRPWRMTYDVFWRMRQRIRLRREEADTADRGGYNMYTYVLAIL